MSDALETRIREILQATPIEDLGTITAKDVRAQLLAEGVIDEAWVKANKKAVNALIAGVFEAVSAPLVPMQSAADHTPKEEYANGELYSEREDTESQLDDYADDNDDDDGGPSTPPAKSHKKAAKLKRELTDEEYARQLSTQLNGRSRSSRTGKAPSARTSKPKKGSSRTPKRKKKSAEHVDDSDGASDDSDGYDSDGQRIAKPVKKKRARKNGDGGGGGAKGGFGKEYLLSEPLSALLEVDRLSRPQVVKQLWVYIKGNNLQNPSNKKEILCDDRLRPVFNADKIDMFKMNKVLGQHLHEAE